MEFERKVEIFWKIFDIVIITVLITCVLVALQFYYNNQFKECVRDPLVYASKMYEDKTGYPFRGSGSFIGENLNAPILFFSSDGVTTTNPLEGIDSNNSFFNIEEVDR